MKVYVTGGTGFFGGRLIEALLEKGEPVRALCRNAEKGKFLLPGDAEILEGDITDIGSLEKTMKGCGKVYHAASLVKMWVKNKRVYEKVNIEGAGNVFRTAQKLGVEKVVYTSSFMALGPSNGEPLDEKSGRKDYDFHNAYERTKYFGYEVAKSYIKRDVPIVITYPGVIYGPGLLTQGNIIVNLIEEFLDRKLPGTIGPGDRKWCYSFIDDVVDGHIRAMEQGGAGKDYILGGDNRTLRELFGILEEQTGVSAPGARLPYWLCHLFGLAYVARARMTGKQPRFTHDVVRVYRHGWAYSSERAKRELGYKTTTLEEGIGKTLDWLGEMKS